MRRLSSPLSLLRQRKTTLDSLSLLYQVSCSEGQRGIYLREPHQLSKPVTKSVSVTTHYDDDVGEFLRMFCFFVWFVTVERFHSRGQHLCKFIGTKESVCIRKEFNSQRIGLGHQYAWPPFHCFGAPIWPPWRHVKTLYRQYPQTTLLRRLEKTDYGTMYAYITTERKRGWRGERHCQCWNTENREKVVVLVVFNVRGKGGNWGNFFSVGGGGDCAVYFPANTTHENPKVGRAHFFSRAFAFS